MRGRWGVGVYRRWRYRPTVIVKVSWLVATKTDTWWFNSFWVATTDTAVAGAVGTTFVEASATAAVPATGTDVAVATAGNGGLCLVYRDRHGSVYLPELGCASPIATAFRPELGPTHREDLSLYDDFCFRL